MGPAPASTIAAPAAASESWRSQPGPTRPGEALPPFRTMRGWGHYHVTYRKVAVEWFIATREQTRTRLEFTA